MIATGLRREPSTVTTRWSHIAIRVSLCPLHLSDDEHGGAVERDFGMATVPKTEACATC